MNTYARPAAPRPAPLPYATQAARREVPAPAPHEIENPDGPLFREDERTLWLCTGVLFGFIVVMLAIAWHLNGGL